MTITNPFSNDGSAIIVAIDYDISGASIVGNSMGDNTELSIGKNEDSSTHTITVTRLGGDTISEGDIIWIKFSGIRNPVTTGDIGTFGISLKTSSSHTTDKDNDIRVVDQLVHGTLEGFTVEPDSRVAGETTGFVVGVELANPLPKDASYSYFTSNIKF